MDKLKLFFFLHSITEKQKQFSEPPRGRFEAHKGREGLSFLTELGVKSKMIRFTGGRRKEINACPNTFDWSCRDARVGGST